MRTRVLRYGGEGAQLSDENTLREHIEGYLTWVRDRFGTIELRGIKREGQQVVQLDLQTVYVPLEAAQLGAQGRRSIAMDQILAVGERLAVTGGPGSGKTTVLQHIAWTLATAIHQDDPGLARDRLGLVGALPLPIFVPLSAYAEHRRRPSRADDPREPTLASFVSRYLIEKQSGLAMPEDFFVRLLASGRAVILLLDGLDEVPNEDDRVAVRQSVEDLVAGRETMRVVVTCRNTAYRERTALGRGFGEVLVLPLKQEHIGALVQQAYAAIYPGDPAARKTKTQELLSGIQRLEDERCRRMGEEADRLVTSPLLVRMLLVVHFSERRLPEQRAELYMKATDAMLLPDYAPDEEAADRIGRLIGGSREAHRDLMQHVAFAMHNRGATQGREITEDELRDILGANPDYEEIVDKFIAITRLRGTLLEERSGAYRFVHLAFQEYLAARYLAEIVRSEQGVAGIARFLVERRVLDNWWREPTLLLVGYLSIASPHTAQMLLRQLTAPAAEAQKLGFQRPPEVALPAAELAAVATLEWQTTQAGLRDEVARRLARAFTSPRARRGAKLSLRLAVGGLLARLGDPRFRADRWYLPDEPMLGFVEIPPGPFVMGSGKGTDSYALDGETPQHEIELAGYYIARYPVTVEQFRAFVTASNHKPGAPDCLRGQANHPVVWVSWHEAMAYCDWLTARLCDLAKQMVGREVCGSTVAWQNGSGEEAQIDQTTRFWQGLCHGRLRVTLPGEPQWEKAARGTDARIHPWGSDADPDKANYCDTEIDSTSPVGCFPGGASPYGCEDMAGNVWEWTRSLWGKEWNRPDFGYPYDPRDGREKLDVSGKMLRVSRGGAFGLTVGHTRCAYRLPDSPDLRSENSGIRVCIHSPLSDL